MGPRFFNRGNMYSNQTIGGVRVASMGPRFFNRGNDPPATEARQLRGRFNGAAVFQPRKLQGRLLRRAGHLASMGPRFFNRGNAAMSRLSQKARSSLQWGRGFSTAETCTSLPSRTTCVVASMGPRFFNRGNAGYEVLKRVYVPASMGPRFFNRGNSAYADALQARVDQRFNGAAVFQPRKRHEP